MPIRPDLFTHTVNQLLYGATASQLSDELAECVGRAQETGKQVEKIKQQTKCELIIQGKP